MRFSVAVFLLTFCGAAYAQPSPQYGPGPCPFGASSCQVKSTSGTTARSLATRFGEVINVKDGRGGVAGAKGDGITLTGCSIAAASPNLTCSGASFTSADVGKLASLDGAGAAGATLGTSILTVTDATHVVLAASASVATPTYYLASTAVATPQSGSGSYAPANTITLTGGTASQQGILAIANTQVASATIAAAGSGGTNGACILSGTTGVVGNGSFDRKFQINATVSGGAVTALGSLVAGYEGGYSTNPTSLTNEPVTSSCGGLTGAQLSLKMGPRNVYVTNLGSWTVLPSNPVAQGSTSGSGTGATVTLTWSRTGTFSYATDDYASITASMNAAVTATHTTVYFPPSAGFYGLSRAVGFAHGDHIAIMGQPGTATLKPVGSNASGTVLLEFDQSNDLFVSGLELDGGGDNALNTSTMLTLFQDTRVNVDHMTFLHSIGEAVNVSTGNVNVTVSNSFFKDIGNRFRRTLNYADANQGLSFCCGAIANNLNNGAFDNGFEDIGLDALGFGAQTNFTVGGANRFNLTNTTVSLIGPQVAWAAAVWGASNIGGSITGTTAIGATGNSIDVGNISNFLIANNFSANSGESAIAVAIGANVSISGNKGVNSNLFGCSTGQLGGISLHGAMTGTTLVSGNAESDNQTLPTLCFGYYGANDLTTINLLLDGSNVTSGNVSGAFGGTLLGNTPPALVYNNGAAVAQSISNNSATGRAAFSAIGQSGNTTQIMSNSAGASVPTWQSSGTLATDWAKLVISAFQSTGTIQFQTGGIAAGNTKNIIDSSGNFTHGAGLFVTTPVTPATAAAACTIGQIAWDTGFMYVCTATNTWKRAAIATW